MSEHKCHNVAWNAPPCEAFAELEADLAGVKEIAEGLMDDNKRLRERGLELTKIVEVEQDKLEADNERLRHLVQLAFERAPQYLGASWHVAYQDELKGIT